MDYPGFLALDSILRNQGFSEAARELNISQSAISQRMSQLESSYGERLLVRSFPYRPTKAGERILAHFRKVRLLEQAFEEDLKIQSPVLPEFRLCLNSDSLELWFRAVLSDPAVASSVRLQISLDDERHTLRHLAEGRVDLAIGSSARKLQNHDRIVLGKMEYVLVCNPQYKARNFTKGLNAGSIQNLTAVVYNQKDDLHQECLQQAISYRGGLPIMCVPSLHRLKDALRSGFGYGVMPRIEIEDDLKAGRLVMPHARATVIRKLYLHHWSYRSRAMMKLIDSIERAAKVIR